MTSVRRRSSPIRRPTTCPTAHTIPCGPNNGASFLFIPDLTNKATGAVLVVLILLYVGTQLGSSLLMSSPTMDKTQRQIMLVMPLFFVIFIINFPAGVIVYWITTNTWTIASAVHRQTPPRSDGSAGCERRRHRRRPGWRWIRWWFWRWWLRRTGWRRSERRPAAAWAALGGLLRGRTKTEEPCVGRLGQRQPRWTPATPATEEEEALRTPEIRGGIDD